MTKSTIVKTQITLLIAALLLVSSTLSAQQSRIINGKPATTSTYPWLASLFIASETDSETGGGCGGSLIAQRWILTAAHCFVTDDGKAVSNSAAERTTITLNSTNISRLSAGAIELAAKRVIVHPDYNPDPDTSSNVHDFDIALIELETPVNITPVRLFTGALNGGVPAIVAGWGATQGDGSAASDTLLATQVLTVSAAACSAYHEESFSANMFCAGGFTAKDTSDTCQGDSGGPLFVMLEEGALQLGITSFGGSETANCGTPGSPGVYARIAELFSFVNDHVPTVGVLNSLADMRVEYNTYLDASDSVSVPKVYGAGSKFAVTLKHNGNYHFSLATADELQVDNLTSVPAYFDEETNMLLLPLVKVGGDTFNVQLRHLGDFNFVLHSADAPD
jgi:secreted trypsin-like serine protease